MFKFLIEVLFRIFAKRNTILLHAEINDPKIIDAFNYLFSLAELSEKSLDCDYKRKFDSLIDHIIEQKKINSGNHVKAAEDSHMSDKQKTELIEKRIALARKLRDAVLQILKKSQLDLDDDLYVLLAMVSEIYKVPTKEGLELFLTNVCLIKDAAERWLLKDENSL